MTTEADPDTKLYVADLFAGAGGLTAGFRDASFTPAVAVEFDRWAAETYAANFGDHVLCAPIESVSIRSLKGRALEWSAPAADGGAAIVKTPPIDVLVGGPPCQGFSPLGRMKDWSKSDPRNRLWREYVRVLAAVNPKVFVIENVPELLTSAEFAVLKSIVTKKLGYEITVGVLNASHYGVPQVRRRAIIIGSRIGRPTLPPETTCRRTVRDAIGDLPKRPNGKPAWHLPRKPTAKSLERYRAVPEGGNRFDLMRNRPDITPDCWINKKTGSTDVFGRMWWDRAAPTIRTEFFKPEKGRYLHPSEHRPITLREAARLQTFDDSFQFVGSAVQVAKQIGNAVPVGLAKDIAEHLTKTLFQSEPKRKRLTQRASA